MGRCHQGWNLEYTFAQSARTWWSFLVLLWMIVYPVFPTTLYDGCDGCIRFDLLRSQAQSKKYAGQEGERYSVDYGKDGRIKVTTPTRPTNSNIANNNVTSTSDNTDVKQHREAEFSNSTIPVRDFDRVKTKTDSMSHVKSEINVLAEKYSEMDIQRPATADANLNILKNSGKDDASSEAQGVSPASPRASIIIKEAEVLELSESLPDLISPPNSESQELVQTPSRKCVGFKSNLVDLLSTDELESVQKRDSTRGLRSNSPKGLLKKHQNQQGSGQELNEPKMTLVQTLNNIGRSRRSRASTPSAPKPSSFGNKSKIPILIPRLTKPIVQSSESDTRSENPSTISLPETSASTKFHRIGIARSPRKTSREGRKRRENVEKLLKSSGGPSGLQQSYADQVMVSQNYAKRIQNMKAPGVKPSPSNSSSSSVSSLHSRMSLCNKLSSTGMQCETPSRPSSTRLPLKAPSNSTVSQGLNDIEEKGSEATVLEESNALVPEHDAKYNGESTTFVFKADSPETFETTSILANDGDKSHQPPNPNEFAQKSMSKLHSAPLPSKPLEVTLPLSQQEVTLTPVLSQESAVSPEVQVSTSEESTTSVELTATQISLDSTPMKLELKKSVGIITPCRFHTAGCPVELPRGTLTEEEHTRHCKFRPLPCLFCPGACDEIVPYHNFLLHQQRHFLVPNYTKSCSTQVVIAQEDFEYNQNWLPKWMSWEGQHFFLMLNHRRGKTIGRTGTWVCWVQMFGTADESAEYFYDIEMYKGANKKIRGTFTMQSIRTPLAEVQNTESGLVFSDLQVKRISGIGDALKKEFYIDVVISRKPVND